MTPQDALDGFKRLQEKFPGSRYKGADLNEVWPALLACPPEAFEWAVGILLKNSRFLPRADYVLERTQAWAAEQQVLARKTPLVIDGGDEGKEAMQIIIGEIDGSISRAEGVSRLYRMSERYGKMEYAAQARNWEKTLNQEAAE